VIVKNTETEVATTVSAADAWNTADAPDKFFAIVPDSAKGPDGNKSERKIPLASIQKKDLDEAIIANALARLPQTNLPTGFTMGSVTQTICRAAHSIGYDPPSCQGAKGDFSKEVDACMTCEHENVIAELTDKNKKLEAQLKDSTEKYGKLDTELKELKAKTPAPPAASDAMVAVQAELKVLKAENESLKAWKQTQEDADHMRRVQDVVDLRIKNGVLDPKTVQAATDALKKLPNDALDAMKADLEAVKGKFDSLPSGPKARLIPSVAARFDPMQPTVGDLVGKKPGEK